MVMGLTKYKSDIRLPVETAISNSKIGMKF